MTRKYFAFCAKSYNECLKVIEETIFDNMMAENNSTVDEKLF